MTPSDAVGPQAAMGPQDSGSPDAVRSDAARQASLLQRRAEPLIFVESIDQPALSADDLHHYRTVRRLADGAGVTLSDGQGRWCSAAFGSEPTITGDVHEDPRPRTEVVVGFAPVKGERPEWIVQKLTELGVARIVPIVSERSIVRWDAKRAAKQHDRWVVVAREAAMQSRQVRLPTIDTLTRFADVVPSATTFVADPDGPPLAQISVAGSVSVMVLIGPEGGFTESERRSHPCRSLPGGVLRAETAALVAAAITQAILPA